ncbi:MAG: AAA family ATPase [Syntrophales bacterium]
MKIISLHAEDVHGYLPIDIEFFPDLTFLTGLNGSGKTTALRLLMALLTPNMEEFSSTTFSRASVKVEYESNDVIVKASKSTEGLELSIDGVSEKLFLSSAELELLSETRHREESKSPVHEKVLANSVFKAIRKMTTPMFLGLDRRSFVSNAPWDDSDEARRKEFLTRRIWMHDPSLRSSTATGLAEVNILIADKMLEIHAAQETLDETLRRKLLTSAFEYKPSDITSYTKAPSRLELERYRERLAHIERAAEGFRLPVPELKTALSGFFESLTNVVDALEKQAKDKKTKSKDKKGIQPEPNKNLLEWLFNKTQADGVLEHLKWLDQYGQDRSALREPIDRFVSLTNSFLEQTNKRVAVEGKGALHIFLQGSGTARPVSSLSSGERQLVVMLAHLSLNKNLAGSGVFIVDEPELSLHMDWQERFVAAIREANPSVQLIMATHSPAIILDRTESCISLSGEYHD